MRQWEEDQAVDTPLLSKMIERAQKKVEQHNFDGRKHVLEYDDVMNVQRERIYGDRRAVLEGADLRETLLGYLHNTVDSALATYCPEGVSPDEWDKSGLYENLSAQFPLVNYMEQDELAALNRREIGEKLHEIADQAYDDKEAEFGSEMMREIERYITVRQIDQAWVEHLANMDYLREGIGLRGYAQVDPLVAYKKEALLLFEQTQAGIQADVVRNLFMAAVQTEDTNGDGEADFLPIPPMPDIFNIMSETGPDSNTFLPEGFDGFNNYDEPSGEPAPPPEMVQNMGAMAKRKKKK